MIVAILGIILFVNLIFIVSEIMTARGRRRMRRSLEKYGNTQGEMLTVKDPTPTFAERKKWGMWPYDGSVRGYPQTDVSESSRKEYERFLRSDRYVAWQLKEQLRMTKMPKSFGR